MEFVELKRSILGEVVRNGYTKADELPANLTSGVSLDLVQRWMDKFFRMNKPDDVPISPRLINHFPIGADPEFAFAGLNDAMANAMDLGLQAGLAFGMDTNGRLAELRPTPSRFALQVLASILGELRWMALLKPATRQYSWISRPYFARDGLGGHVHFGRKRLGVGGRDREKEIKILDDLAALLIRGGVFNRDSCTQRRGAQGGYGKAADIRLQKHGYEYRTMPTWLDNPWLAYLTLVLSKLVVHDPGLLHGLHGQANVKRVIRNILAFYKGLDDDALIAYNALAVHGLPQQVGTDFRAAWGINYAKDTPIPDVDYIPSTIEATPADMQAVFSYLLCAKPIAPMIPEPNWTPLKFLKDYQGAIHYSQTYHRVGIGELLYNVILHTQQTIVFATSDYPTRLQVQVPTFMYDKTMKLLHSNAHTKLGIANIEFLVSKRDGQIQVYLGEKLRSGEALSRIKKFLLSGWLPVWHIDEVKPESYQVWLKSVTQQAAPVAPARSRGKEITAEGAF
jgi:Phage phiEco32-like COOH.NH2 ligase-type 2